MRSVGPGCLIPLGVAGALAASSELWGLSGLVLASCVLLLGGCLFVGLQRAVAVACAELSQQLENCSNDLSNRLDNIELEISDQSDHDSEDDGDEDEDNEDGWDDDEEDDSERDSRRLPTPPSGIAYIFQTLPARFQDADIEKPRTYYFSLDEGEKWTVNLSKDSCEVTRGQSTKDADCVFESSNQMFLDVWSGNYAPSARDFLTGTIKCNDPSLLKVFVAAFRKV